MIYDYYLNCYVTPMPTYTVCLQCKKKKKHSIILTVGYYIKV